MPALSVIKRLKAIEPDCEILYIGSKNGIENQLITTAGIPFQSISTGKLRRYFSVQNFIDLFKVLWGIVQSFFIMHKYSRKNTVVVSWGGFVTIPVVIGSWLTGKKIFLHEQTMRVGLANKIASFFATKIMVTFSSSQENFPKAKTVCTGYPLRDEFQNEDLTEKTLKGVDLLNPAKPILFVTGGGNGAKILNEVIFANLNTLKEKYIVFHQVGAAFETQYQQYEDESYKVFGFIKNMPDLIKVAKVVVSRAGAGTVCELMALGKPSIFIPLKIAQKNEQFHNAKAAQELVGSQIVLEDNIDDELLTAILNFDLVRSPNKLPDGRDKIIQIISNFDS